MPIIPVLGRLRQENYKFKASLGYLARLCFKTSKQQQPSKNNPCT
jgi:hypothetical protein